MSQSFCLSDNIRPQQRGHHLVCSSKTLKSHITEVNEEMKTICFTNLLLLGFDPQAEENINKIKFHRDMFDDVNKIGCEVVLHFLFYKLNSDLAKEEFKICYPVLDRKQEQMFRKACSTWILNIAKENRELNFPSALSSILMKKGGRKFYPLLFSLSRFVLFEVVKTELGQTHSSHLLYPTKLTKLADVEASKKLFQALLDEHMNNFVTNQLYVVRHVKEERLQNLVTRYYYLKKEIKVISSNLETLLDDLEIPKESQLKIVQGEDCDEWNSILENTKKKEQRLNEEWNTVEGLLDVKEKLWDICDMVVIRQKRGTFLHGRELRDAFTHREAKNIDLGDPLRLSRVCNAWVDSLSRILGQFEKIEIPNINIFSDDLVRLHVNQLNNMEKFKMMLCEEALANVQQDCFNLWKNEFTNTNYEEYKEQVKAWQSETTNQLCIPSPPMSINQSFESTIGSRRGRYRRRISRTSCDGRVPVDTQSRFTKLGRKSVSEESRSSSSNDSKIKRIETSALFKDKSDFSQNSISFEANENESLNLSENKADVSYVNNTGRAASAIDSKSICSQSESNDSYLPRDFVNVADGKNKPLGDRLGKADRSLEHFDPDSEFNLSLLESPLCRPIFEMVEQLEPLKMCSSPTKSNNVPPRLLQLLNNMKLNEPQTIDTCSSPEGIGSTVSGGEQITLTLYDLSVDSRSAEEQSVCLRLKPASLQEIGITSESDAEPDPDPDPDPESALSTTLGSTPRSLPLMLSSNLRDFLSWEHVLQSGVSPQQDDLLLRETKSAIEGNLNSPPPLPSFHPLRSTPVLNNEHIDKQQNSSNLSLTVDKKSIPEESGTAQMTLSRTNLSLADIFGEDDSCLLPPSPNSS